MASKITGYLKSMMEPDEKPVCRTALHGIYLVNGFFWLFLLSALGWGADLALWHYLGAYVPQYEINTHGFHFGLREGWIGWLFTACGAVIFLTEYIRLITTDIYITTKRVIYKTGWLNVKVNSTDISDVRGVRVDQGWLGRFLDYGKVHLDCRFIADVDLPFTRAPYRVMKDIQEIKSEVEHPTVPPHFVEQHSSAPQTIIQINPGYGSGLSLPTHPGETIVIKTGLEQDVLATQKQEAIEHQAHDAILHDFKEKA
ncbi:MAG: hypothetical protein DI551_12225 [Micavibrio aeruginosavorus]|uniref:YdbS-like PH domain-containing protein n=1 Tax=Micavibrio aeruginosavorus TaxID=349221 RepID=A0A2W5PFU6_9BACT|nr:MAG: hypothetical protein DI551_12225 [Micavibrio aeruginosavorus]